MSGSRMEAFSDGVLAIVITIMVLKLDTPKSMKLSELRSIFHIFLAYVLSYFYVGIYWVNHHHLLKVIHEVSGRLLWRNLHWIFWMTLIPTATEWMGLNPYESIPTLFYGVILFMCAVSYNILQAEVLRISGKDSDIAKSIGKDRKGKASIVAYALAILFALVVPAISYLIFMAMAFMWIVPDRRIEKIITG